MITLNEALNYLKLEREDLPKVELDEIKGLITAAKSYLINAVGPVHEKHRALAKLFCRMVIADWYDNRGTTDSIKAGARAILSQIANTLPTEDDSS